MKALVRKDAVWIGICLVVGVAVFAGFALDGGGAWFAAAGVARETFWAAAISGLLLGFVARGFDRVLGMADALRLRPLGAGRLVLGSAVSCALVLAGWMLLTPALVWAVMSWLYPEQLLVGFDGVYDFWATMAVAWSMAAVGLFAAGLPVHPVLRLLVGGCAGYVVLLWVGEASRPGSHTDALWFVLLHAAAAAGFGLLAVAAGVGAWDPDRPLPRRVYRSAAPVAVAAVALTATFGLAALAEVDLSSLLARYPQLLVQREHVELWQPNHLLRERAAGSVLGFANLVDAEHQPNGRSVPRPVREIPRPLPSVRVRVEPDPPRWPRRLVGREWAVGGEIVVRVDGTAVFRRGRSTVQVSLPRPAGPFAEGSRLIEARPDAEAPHALWLVEPGAEVAWTFDFDELAFVAHRMPDGEAVLGSDLEYLLTQANAERPGLRASWVVRTTKGHYRLGADGIAPVSPRVEPKREAAVVEPIEPPVSFRATVAAAADHSAFVHTYLPRTGEERWFAGKLVWFSLLRPPLSQAAAHFGAGPGWSDPQWPERGTFHAWWQDPMVCDGRRPWLVLSTAAMAAVLALALHWRLRRRGVPAGAARTWALATAAFGPVVAISALCVETPRRHAERRLPAPAPAPLIFTRPQPASSS